MLDSIEAVLERECDFPPDLAHASRKADVLVVANAALPRGPVVATPFAAKARLIDGHVPPAGVVLG
jgi:hypothetical protein